MKKIFLAVVSFLFLAASLSFAEDKIETKISGQVFANYSYVLSDNLQNGAPADGLNAFDISRVQLNAQTKFTDQIGSFVQFEGNLITGCLETKSATSNILYLKQAYLEYKDLYPKGTLQVGMVSNPWIDFENSVWKNRFLAKTLADEDIGLSTTDRGVKVKGTFPYIAYDAMVVNGEGTGARLATGNENNKYKDEAIRVAVSPFDKPELKGLKINAYLHQGYSAVESKRNRSFFGVSYESSVFNAMGTYYTTETGIVTTKGAGYSIHGNYFFMNDKWVFARYDSIDTNVDTPNNAYTRMIIGVGEKLAANVKLALAFAGIKQETEVLSLAGAGMANQNTISTNFEIKF